MSATQIDQVFVDLLSDYYVAGGGIASMHKRINGLRYIEKGEYADIDVALDTEVKFLRERFLFRYRTAIIVNDKSIIYSNFYLTKINELDSYASETIGRGGIFDGGDVIVLPVFPVDGFFFFFQHNGHFFYVSNVMHR